MSLIGPRQCPNDAPSFDASQIHYDAQMPDPTDQGGENLFPRPQSIDQAARGEQKNQKPCVVWFTGLSGAGKSTISQLLDRRLYAMGYHAYTLDGDNLRSGLNRDLGFSAVDRVENIRRVGEVAALMVDAGLIVLAAFISPFRAERRLARSLVAPGQFLEVHLNVPLAIAEARDPKGLYRKARRGEIRNFTGVDSPYEIPEHPELVVDTALLTPDETVDAVVSMLRQRDICRREVT